MLPRKHSVIKPIKAEIDICKYAEAQSLILVKHGRYGEFHTKQHDSLVLNPSKNMFYWFSRGEGGSVIDLAMQLYGYTVDESISHLRGLLTNKPEHIRYKRDPQAHARTKPAEKQAFVLPEKSKVGYGRLFAYLCKSRGIEGEVVKAMVNKELLYLAVYQPASKEGNLLQKPKAQYNACFCGKDYDGEIKLATQRGTNTMVEWRGTCRVALRKSVFPITL